MSDRKWRVAAWLVDRRGWWRLQPVACLLLGHESIPAAHWHVTANGYRCAYCGKDLA